MGRHRGLGGEHYAAVTELGISLLSSAIAGVAVSVFSWLGRRRRADRMRALFGLRPGAQPLLVISRHWSSSNERSVHLNDAAAVVDVAATMMRCGAQPELVGHDQAPAALGAVTEVCVGGPHTNSRTAAHLRLLVPGIQHAKYTDDPSMTITVGGSGYPMDDDVTYVLVAKAFGRNGGAPVFLISGQLAISNRTAARYLVEHHRELANTYGLAGRFAVLLQLRGVDEYGTDAVELVENVTASAFS
jgi:hypothetical protein